ncbi:hypothetical protein VP01_682g4 [Puccinia sorghi]|uniref:Uncharacterized protein n=1 Tax=Puccinia sorghi TaxID=27349 RepID=A0A0L6UEF2_9BASI|nr:hypothetical protein VP01_682g4 [Puccinia sorghi]
MVVESSHQLKKNTQSMRVKMWSQSERVRDKMIWSERRRRQVRERREWIRIYHKKKRKMSQQSWRNFNTKILWVEGEYLSYCFILFRNSMIYGTQHQPIGIQDSVMICGQSAFRIQFSISDQPQLTLHLTDFSRPINDHQMKTFCFTTNSVVLVALQAVMLSYSACSGYFPLKSAGPVFTESTVQISYPNQSGAMFQTPTRKIASIKFHTSKNATYFTMKGGPISPPAATSCPSHRQEIPLPIPTHPSIKIPPLYYKVSIRKRTNLTYLYNRYPYWLKLNIKQNPLKITTSLFHFSSSSYSQLYYEIFPLASVSTILIIFYPESSSHTFPLLKAKENEIRIHTLRQINKHLMTDEYVNVELFPFLCRLNMKKKVMFYLISLSSMHCAAGTLNCLAQPRNALREYFCTNMMQLFDIQTE